MPKPCVMYCDNQSAIAIAIAIAQCGVITEGNKHFFIKYYVIEQCQKGVLTLKYVSSANNKVDIFTKRLPGPRTLLLSKKIGLKNLYNRC